MMTRREWLARVLGTMAASIVATQVDLTDMTPAFWQQPAITALKPWRVVFPNGTILSFDAIVKSERILAPVDGLASIEMELQPTGPMEMLKESRSRSVHARGTAVFRDGVSIGEIQEIALPRVSCNVVDVTSADDEYAHYIPGLREISPMTIRMSL